MNLLWHHPGKECMKNYLGIIQNNVHKTYNIELSNIILHKCIAMN